MYKDSAFFDINNKAVDFIFNQKTKEIPYSEIVKGI